MLEDPLLPSVAAACDASVEEVLLELNVISIPILIKVVEWEERRPSHRLSSEAWTGSVHTLFPTCQVGNVRMGSRVRSWDMNRKSSVAP
jgi:hypothetical protein